VLQELHADTEGLSASEAKARLARYGPNRVDRSRRDGPVTILLRQLATPLVYILVASATAAVFLGRPSTRPSFSRSS
jgi:magnesium-transporting ATPase (P-type)